MAYDEKIVAEALVEYQKNELMTKEIAKKYGVSASTLTVWATAAGIKLRSRGRRRQDEPTMRQKEIIKMAQVLRYEDVGRRHGISKQAVHRLLRRWKEYAQPKRPPFEGGDIIIWKGQKFTVVNASINEGTLLNRRGQLTRCFAWNSSGRMPKKIGVNPAYIVEGTRVASLPDNT
jgi:transposase